MQIDPDKATKVWMPAVGPEEPIYRFWSVADYEKEIASPYHFGQEGVPFTVFQAVGPQSPEVLRGLATALKSPHGVVRTKAAVLLSRMGTEARAAVPLLLPLLRDTYSPTRRAAAEVLGRIDPNALKKAVPQGGNR